MENFLEKYLSLILGSTDLATYAASFTLALIGALIVLIVSAKLNRDKNSEKTPTNFSTWFAIQDNALRLFLGFLVTYIVIRFFYELTGKEFTLYISVAVGATSDQIALVLYKFLTGVSYKARLKHIVEKITDGDEEEAKEILKS